MSKDVFNMSQQSITAVLTGDVVNSRKLSDEKYEDLLYTLNNLLAFVCLQHNENQHQMMRGDSFQVVIHDAKHALRYAVLIRTGLKERHASFDCRISIGIGKNEVIRHNIGNSTGDAFTLSGQALDSMKQARLSVMSPSLGFNNNIQLLIKYLDHQINEFTQRQSAICSLKLRNKELTQQDIADVLEANRVSISRSLKASRFDLLQANVSLFTQHIEGLVL